MTSHPSAVRNRAFVLAVTGLLAGWSCAAGQEPVSVEGRPRLAKLRKLGTGAALTILPVLLQEQEGLNKEVADVVGLLLEKQGRMRDVRTVNIVFEPPPNTPTDQVPPLLARWVANQRFETGYVLWAQVLGTPKTGVREIRVTIVTRTGELVWSDRQTPKHQTFQRIGPHNPMTCAMLIAERVQAALAIPRPDDPPVTNGRMARLWAEKSGTPSAADVQAMETRRRAFCQRRGKARLLVFPAQVNGKPDATTAAGVVGAVRAAGFTRVEASDAAPFMPVKFTPNEQKRLWDLARSFRDYVRREKPDADYALFVEYLISQRTHEALAVHFVVCDRAGQWVMVDFQNNHHPDFKRIAPRSVADCDRLLRVRLERACD